MLIKESDDKSKDLEILQILLKRSDVSADTKRKIEQEIRNIASGAKGEADAAYEINFHYGQSKNWAVIHDLRLEHKGRVAQIDHLLINRFLDIWVCESKRFSEGIAINENGECAMFWNGRPQGIGSPYEQNVKHMAVIKAAFDDGVVELPKRLGFSIKPVVTGLVVVSKNARISRPKAKGWWNDGIVKADSVKARIEKTLDSDNNILFAAKIIGTDTLENFAKGLAALHAPASFDWYAKFGLPRVAPVQEKSVEIVKVPEPVVQVDAKVEPVVEVSVQAEPVAQVADGEKKSKLSCSSCGNSVQYNVAKFCWYNKLRFGGKVYCFECQKNIFQPLA